VTQALDAAISEARQAVVTMRTGLERDRPLHDLLEEAVEDFAADPACALTSRRPICRRHYRRAPRPSYCACCRKR
jgi:hypothetical protein